MNDTGFTRRQFAFTLAGSAVALSACSTTLRSAAANARLDAFRQKARDLGVRAAVVLRDGEVALADGEVHEPQRIASVRKSFVSALFGMAVAAGRVKLDTTLAELGVDDYSPLTEAERRATIHDLLKARSGVYLATAAETAAMKAARPARGSHEAGTFWYYNNWDFNVLGEIYQRTTGEGLFTALEHRIARPLGFRDFDPLKHARWAYDRESPRFPAYNLFLSAWDMAQFGQLFLQRGQWKGQQLVPESWVAECTRSYSLTGRAGAQSGYGYMWWVVADDATVDRRGLPAGTYTAAGNGGRYITIFPELRVVVAVQPNERQGQPPVPLYSVENAYSDLLAEVVKAYGDHSGHVATSASSAS
jgi:CubicO group peptidase (beta-lactamase class C family)